MQVRTGIDIIEVNRIEEIIEKDGEKFLSRVFTAKEIEYCENKKAQKFQSYAARFAAKEAVLKAISGNIENKYNIEWKDIEILNGKDGRPYVSFSEKLQAKGFQNSNVDVSLSHIKESTVASAVFCK